MSLESAPVTERNWRYRTANGTTVFDLNPVVFGISAGMTLALLAVSIAFRGTVSTAVDRLQATIANATGWFLVLATNLVLAFLALTLLSSRARLRLGGAEAQPEFTRLAWIAMLFSAGMGIGLMFYGVAEPLYHLSNPPHGASAFSTAAYQDAVATTYLHWGLHAWGIYTLVGLALAFFAFNHNQPLSLRAVLRPVLGERANGPLGDLVDIAAAVATLFGVATSLGLGVRQVNAGLDELAGIGQGPAIQLVLIALITAVATLSVIAGLDKGIRRLSVLNVCLALGLLGFVLVAGPTLFILNGLVENLGLYLDEFFALGFWNETYTRGSWQNGWTVFYWGWWFAWSPFVGMFIARISYGRTVGEFIVGVLGAGTAMTFVWLAVFGNTALFIELEGPGGLVDATRENVARALFVFLEQVPGSGGLPELPAGIMILAGALATLLVVTFFVTSSDSGSLVIDMITAGGHPNPPVSQRVFWATMEGLVAGVLLVCGGLTALQTAAISTGLPLAVLVLLMIVSLSRAMGQTE